MTKCLEDTESEDKIKHCKHKALTWTEYMIILKHFTANSFGTQSLWLSIWLNNKINYRYLKSKLWFSTCQFSPDWYDDKYLRFHLDWKPTFICDDYTSWFISGKLHRGNKFLQKFNVYHFKQLSKYIKWLFFRVKY